KQAIAHTDTLPLSIGGVTDRDDNLFTLDGAGYGADSTQALADGRANPQMRHGQLSQHRGHYFLKLSIVFGFCSLRLIAVADGSPIAAAESGIVKDVVNLAPCLEKDSLVGNSGLGLAEVYAGDKYERRSDKEMARFYHQR